MPQPARPTAASTDFREAIAHWRLALRTEVKRCSSLPSSMFDACDPMLETRLADTAETVLMSLLGKPPRPSDDDPVEHVPERREQVSSAELRMLPGRAAAPLDDDLRATELSAGLDEEYLAILTDICCNSAGEPLRHALLLLDRDFGVRDARDVEELRARIRARTEEDGA